MEDNNNEEEIDQVQTTKREEEKEFEEEEKLALLEEEQEEREKQQRQGQFEEEPDFENVEKMSELEVYTTLLRISDLLSNTKITKALEWATKLRKYSLMTAQLHAEIVQFQCSMEDSPESFTSCYSLLEAIEVRALNTYNALKQQQVKSEEELKKLLESTVALAEINGMMAMMHGRRSNKLRAAHKARKSWKFFEEGEKVLALIPSWSFDGIVKRDCKVLLVDSINADHLYRPQKNNNNGNGNEGEGEQNGGDIGGNNYSDYLDEDEKRDEEMEKMKLLYGKDRFQHIVEGDHLKAHYIVSKLYFGASLFRYGVSMLPPSLQWLVEKFGFPSADREEAIRKLDLISQMPASTRQLLASGVLIATKYFFFDEKNLALKAVKQMIQLFPESIFFRVIMAQLQRREGNYDLSTECFKIAIKYTEEENLYQANRTLRYELGNNYWAYGKYEEALPYYENFLQNTTSPTFKCYCAFRLCYCLIITQQDKLEANRGRIMDILKKASSVWVNKDMSYDVWAARLAQQLMKSNLVISPMVRALNLATGYVDASLSDLAHAELDRINQMLEEKRQKGGIDYNDYAQYLYLRARLLRKSDVEGCISNFTTLLTPQIINKVNVEKWVIPHAEMEYCEVLFEQGKYSMSQAVLNSCKKRSGFDFEKQLSFSIKRMERKLKVIVVDG